MKEFLAENLSTILVGAFLLVIVVAVIASMAVKRKKGKRGCCGCAGCPLSGSCKDAAKK